MAVAHSCETAVGVGAPGSIPSIPSENRVRVDFSSIFSARPTWDIDMRRRRSLKNCVFTIYEKSVPSNLEPDMRTAFILSLAIMVASLVVPAKAWTASGSATYTYDSRGRLQTVTYGNGTTITYTYDNAGSRVEG